MSLVTHWLCFQNTCAKIGLWANLQFFFDSIEIKKYSSKLLLKEEIKTSFCLNMHITVDNEVWFFFRSDLIELRFIHYTFFWIRRHGYSWLWDISDDYSYCWYTDMSLECKMNELHSVWIILFFVTKVKIPIEKKLIFLLYKHRQKYSRWSFSMIFDTQTNLIVEVGLRI